MALGMRPLMSGLTHIELKFHCGCLSDNDDDDDDEGEGEDEDEDEYPDKVIVAELLSLLKHSPYLSSLEFAVDLRDIDDVGYDIGGQPLMDILSKLPLESITSVGLHLGFLPKDYVVKCDDLADGKPMRVARWSFVPCADAAENPAPNAHRGSPKL
ncbi:hypothetical protein FRC10_001652 [Ceratobasidium sp. 414]|nr:hypothetical protein FRC10_001652 [Ceratobasidium sp. 414]